MLSKSDEYAVDIWGSAFLKQSHGKVTSQIAFGFDHFYQNSLELWGSLGQISQRIFTAGPKIQPQINYKDHKKNDNFLLAQDNHFINILRHFFRLIKNLKIVTSSINKMSTKQGLWMNYVKKQNSKKLTQVASPSLPPLSEYVEYLEQIWKTGILTHNGPLVQEFERGVCNLLGLPNFVAVSNGTIALQMAIKALNLKVR